MIGTLLRIWWTSLSRDRVAQSMTFLLPIAFFSIFAIVFGGRGREAMSRVPVLVVDEDRSEASARLVRTLGGETSLAVVTRARRAGAPRDAAEQPLDRPRAEAMVRGGDAPVAIVLPSGFGASLGRFGAGGASVELLSDPSNPIAAQMVNGLLQKSAMTAMPDLYARTGFDAFQQYAGPLSPQQKSALDSWLPELRRYAAGGDSGGGRADTGDSAPGAVGNAMSGLLHVRPVEVVGERKENGMVSFYAAGIAVMFLLFSASAAGGALLEEMESGTLERVLGSRLGMNGLLFGKWIYLASLGILQITVMFVWGMVAFRLDLLHHLPGFVLMTVVTAAAAAGFGLMLAAFCRTRAQLGSIATIVILCSSAVGGSMFPRFLMSESLQRAGLVTFNAWALDGYVKVFWRNAPLADLAPQVGMIVAFGVVFLAVARLLARRWDVA
jgi:ABC-2 type transport system permease protein